jgi:hypothetical protein
MTRDGDSIASADRQRVDRAVHRWKTARGLPSGTDAASSYTHLGISPLALNRLADDIAEVIRLNPIPWLFAPGIALGGWFYDGVSGAVQALALWAAVVSAATVWVIVRRRWRPDDPNHAP